MFENHISLDSTGHLRPCCAWRNTGTEPLASYINAYPITGFYKNIEQQFEQDTWPAGCEDCRLEEAEGQTSLRQESFEQYTDGYTDAEIKFGNLCNLACNMCGPTNSSLIATEYSAMRDNGLEHPLINRPSIITNAWYENTDSLKRMAKFMSDRNQLRFTGGEPTVNTYLQDFLEEVSSHNTDMTIQITTNGNNWPARLNEILDRFKRKKISLSLDAHGTANEYIRYPSKWSKIERNLENIKQLSNTKLMVATTVGAYNLHLQQELSEWVKSHNIDTHIFNPIWGPEIMMPCNATDDHKQAFADLCAAYKPARKVLPSVMKQGTGMQAVVEYFKLLDKHRGTDIGVLGL